MICKKILLRICHYSGKGWRKEEEDRQLRRAFLFKQTQLSRLVAKLRSCPVAATGIVRAGFIFTIPDAEEIAAGVIVENKVRLASLLLLIVDIGTIA